MQSSCAKNMERRWDKVLLYSVAVYQPRTIQMKCLRSNKAPRRLICRVECLHTRLISGFIFSFPCCHYPHISCRRWLDGLNVSERLVLTSVSLQGLPTVQQRPVTANTLRQFWLWWSVGDSYFMLIRLLFPIFPTWSELKSKSSSDRAEINMGPH